LHSLAPSVGSPRLMEAQGKQVERDSTILLLEDIEADVFLFRRMLGKLEFAGQVRVAENGTAAKSYLLGWGEFGDRVYYPMPQLIVADLKMPRMNGLEFLEWYRGQSFFDRIPLVIFSGSELDEDRDRALSLGATRYFVKTGDFPELLRRGREILALLRTKGGDGATGGADEAIA
jgi:CheY-like chemotaxis protein